MCLTFSVFFIFIFIRFAVEYVSSVKSGRKREVKGNKKASSRVDAHAVIPSPPLFQDFGHTHTYAWHVFGALGASTLAIMPQGWTSLSFSLLLFISLLITSSFHIVGTHYVSTGFRVFIFRCKDMASALRSPAIWCQDQYVYEYKIIIAVMRTVLVPLKLA